MTFPRLLVLTLGTVLIVGICYAIAAPQPRPIAAIIDPAQPPSQAGADPVVLVACQNSAKKLRQRCERNWTVLIQAPFVLAGDLPADQLQALYQQGVIPVMRALMIDYFDHEPQQPITILACTSDESYRSALSLSGHVRQTEYSGLYDRKGRTVILNLSSGTGTLAHELTHALAHADFPGLPEWLDEGLASLHEESEFSADGLHLVGRDNWRRRFLLEANERDRWKPLSALLEQPFAQADVAALDYALARYFCLYLQDRGLLAVYYRKCRAAAAGDPMGRQALLKLWDGSSLEAIDRDFRTWVTARP